MFCNGVQGQRMQRCLRVAMTEAACTMAAASLVSTAPTASDYSGSLLFMAFLMKSSTSLLKITLSATFDLECELMTC